MIKIGLFTAILITIGALGIATMSTPADADPSSPPPCTRKVFKTKMIKEACASGGQAAAKTAMRKFVAEHKIAACTECHVTQFPSYKIKDTAFKHYQELGGE